MDEPRVGRMRDRLLLHGGVHRHPLAILALDRLRPVRYRKALLQQRGDLFLTQPCGIRGKAATDSDGRRPAIPIESGHPIRTKAATLLIG